MLLLLLLDDVAVVVGVDVDVVAVVDVGFELDSALFSRVEASDVSLHILDSHSIACISHLLHVDSL